MQTLVRSMPDLHKTLILAYMRPGSNEVQELAMATEHAPFRHKRSCVATVGSQRKNDTKPPQEK